MIHTREGDYRPPFIQGVVEICVDQVLRKRECIFTNFRDKVLSMKHVNKLPRHIIEKAEKFNWVFEQGILICRYVSIIGLYGKDSAEKSYKGEARFLYKRESEEFSRLGDSPSATSSPSIASQCRSASASEVDHIDLCTKSETNPPQNSTGQKTRQYTLNDLFCGIGGVSDGARQAGYRVHLGLEKDELIMRGYAKNFPEAMHLQMDAHDFPSMVKRELHGADHCHLSCPCKFWSPAQ